MVFSRFSCMFLVLFLSISVAAPLRLSLAVPTGDIDFDIRLKAINFDAKQNLAAFYATMNDTYGMQKSLLDKILYELHFSPADAFMIGRCAMVTEKPLILVAEAFRVKRRSGWSAIRKKLGIKTGSTLYDDLKKLDAITIHEKTQTDQPVVLNESSEKKRQKSGQLKK